MGSGYQEARERAAFHLRRNRGRVGFTGADAASFLHALLTNDIAGLTPGRGCYAALLTPQGRMISDMEVLRTVAPDGAERVLLSVPASLAADLAVRFDRSIFAEDVAVEDLSASTAQFGVIGPQAGRAIDAALEALGLAPASARLTNSYENAELGGGVTAWRGEALDGLDTFELVVPFERVEEVRAALGTHAAPLSEEAFTTLRVEGARPEFLVDMTSETIPLEANLLDRAISTSKGCYVGQEVIIRVLHRGGGRVAKRLVQLKIEGSDVPTAGTVLSAGDKDVGRVTTAAWSPRHETVLALGYIHRDHTEPGTEVRLPDGRAAIVREIAGGAA